MVPSKTDDNWVRYAVECDVLTEDSAPQVLAERCRNAAEAERGLGHGVRFLRCVYLPERSAAVLLFEAADAATVAAVTERALGAPAVAVALGAVTEHDSQVEPWRTK